MVRLERASRTWRAIAIATSALLIAGFSFGQTRRNGRVIDADQVTFRNAAGKVRMELRGAPAEGKLLEWYGLMFYDEAGKESARVRMSGNRLEIQMKGSAADELRSLEEVERTTNVSDEIKALFRSVAKSRDGDVTVLNSRGLFIMTGPGGKLDSGTAVGAGIVSVKDGMIKVEGRVGNVATVIGKTQTVDGKSGAVTMHSPASMLMFNDEGKVIFRAP